MEVCRGLRGVDGGPLPLQICTSPITMMSPRASSFPAVNRSCTRVTHRTLEQFTHVSSAARARDQKVRHRPATSGTSGGHEVQITLSQ